MKPNVVILTGAGISAESGVKTFRDNNGLWENHRVEDVATPEAFERNPRLVYQFYNQRRAQLHSESLQPNRAHIALAELQHHLGAQLTLITQNVDNLHERAGSVDVVHMHGELLSARCLSSGKSFYVDTDFDETSRCSCCQPSEAIRPDIVWFGEIPFHMDRIENALFEADYFLSIGTSGHVYPAAGFVQAAKSVGAKTVELNLEPSANNQWFDEQYHGSATTIVPNYIKDTFLK